MDKRSWPWKKKSSDKAVAEKTAAALESAAAPSASAGSLGDQSKKENYKKPNYVQISVESYTHLTGLEDQVKSYEDQVKTLEDEVNELNEKLSEANAEMVTKENLVKQHAKVAEEAVSGWEKAEAEASALKDHLESVTLLKLTAEDRASHLDGALKECMRQIRNLKEEHEQKMHEFVTTKTKQWDKIKHELETKIANLDQELFRSAAENAAISRSLQERSNMLVKMSEEKSQAEADIEILKSNVDSCERDINTYKYELHLVTKELEIRNEEKNMSVRSAEAANRQHLEGVKKIAKLEAECQRLRGLVRKKLPGPAALAQMRLEVENLGRDYGETRLRRSPVKPPTPLPDFSLETVQKYHKENELLTERLLAMEEETKMLKEALAKRNSELQSSRNICAKTVSRLQSLEGQVKSTAKSNVHVPTEGSFSQNASVPPSLTSMSEDGNDDVVSCAGSWATALISELSQFKKEKNIASPQKAENTSQLELMDDFLEMEKLANSSNDADDCTKSEVVKCDAVEVATDVQPKEQSELDLEENKEANSNLLPFMKLQSRISVVFESVSKESDMEKVLDDIRNIVQDTHNSRHQHSLSCDVESIHSSHDRQACPDEAEVTAEKDISLSRGSQGSEETVHDSITQEVAASISQIYDFVLLLGKEANEGDELSQQLEDFSVTYNDVVNNKTSLNNFIVCLSLVLGKANELRFNILGYKNDEAETSSPDCIDKVALPENKALKDSSRERYPNGCAHFSDPDIPHEGNFVPTSESNPPSWKCSLEEFEQLKLEKDNTVMDLARCSENLESTKSQLQETEQLLAEVKSQLTSAQKSNSLSETQLKCMAESYKSLETRAEELQTELNLLRAKTESMDVELQQERKSHQEALARCKDFQEQLERIENSTALDVDAKNNQDRDIAAAAEKLAECQETIFLLGKQLKGLRPQADFMGSPSRERSQKGEGFTEEEPTTSGMNLQDTDPAEMDNSTFASPQRIGIESPMDLYNSPFSPSDSEANNLLRSPISSKHPNHRPSLSGSSSSSSAPTPEKHSRGFSRFFSTKGKNGN